MLGDKMTIDLKAWIARHGLERSAELLGADIRSVKRIAEGRTPPRKTMERLAAALDRIAELESQLRRKNLPPGRPPRVGPGAPLLPRPKPIMGQDELQDEVDWVRGRV